MGQTIATTPQVDHLIDRWIAEGRFANRSEAFRAGVFALKEKLDAETFDPDFVTIVRELDRASGGAAEPTPEDLAQIASVARKHRRR
jgi:Arc/MetJ-type ribon-helix-helix transcriptional regulator